MKQIESDVSWLSNTGAQKRWIFIGIISLINKSVLLARWFWWNFLYVGNIRSAGNQYEINQTNGINNVILIISKNSINSSMMSVLLKSFFSRRQNCKGQYVINSLKASNIYSKKPFIKIYYVLLIMFAIIIYWNRQDEWCVYAV